MWEARVTCQECGSQHSLHTSLEAKPRAFAYVCPDARTEVAVRFVDPSLYIAPWAEVETPAPGSIEVASAESGGSFQL